MNCLVSVMKVIKDINSAVDSEIVVKKETNKLMYFFGSLLLFLLVYPFFENLMVVLIALISVKIIAGTYVFTHDKKHLVIVGLFSLPYLVFNWLAFLSPKLLFMQLSFGFSVLFYGAATTILLYHVFKSNFIGKEEIFAVLSVYLVLGFGFASAFALVETITPGSFAGPIEGMSQKPLDFVYYSFETLTTLGYGDITPITNRARSLSILEAIAGVLFIAVMIARFVGMYHRKDG
jgi:hypothetical protein